MIIVNVINIKYYETVYINKLKVKMGCEGSKDVSY